MTKTIQIREFATKTKDFQDFDSLIDAHDYVCNELQGKQVDMVMPDGTEYLSVDWVEVISILKELSPWKQEGTILMFQRHSRTG